MEVCLHGRRQTPTTDAHFSVSDDASGNTERPSGKSVYCRPRNPTRKTARAKNAKGERGGKGKRGVRRARSGVGADAPIPR